MPRPVIIGAMVSIHTRKVMLVVREMERRLDYVTHWGVGRRKVVLKLEAGAISYREHC